MATTKDINELSMLDLFKMETVHHCTLMSNELAVLEQGAGEDENIANFRRSVHSIKGASQLVDLKQIIKLCQAVEQLFSCLDLNQVDAWLLEQLNTVVDFLNRLSGQENEIIESWLQEQQETVISIIDRLTIDKEQGREAQSSTFPSAFAEKTARENFTGGNKRQPSALVDISLLNIFQEDASNYCAILTNNLLELEHNTKNYTLIESAMRSTHCIKGAARVVNCHQIVDLAHFMEDVFVAAQRGICYLNNDMIDIMLSAVDLIKEIAELNMDTLHTWFNDERKMIFNMVIDALKKMVTETTFSRKDDEPINITGKKDDDRDINEVKSGNASEQRPRLEATVTRKQHNSVVRQKESEKRTIQAKSHVKVSGESMNRIMGLAGEMLVEARWQPSLYLKTFCLKRTQEDIFKMVEDIRQDIFDKSSKSQLELAFVELAKKTTACQNFVTTMLAEVDEHSKKATKISHYLHQEVLRNRMQPFSEGVKGFPRMIRDLAKELGKKVRLIVTGGETLIDRDILGKMEAPLNHLMANALDHGVEFPQQRVESGKDEIAKICIEAKHLHGVMLITVTDDGGGIDFDRLRQTIIEKKLVTEKIANDLREKELLEFLFLPNFTTKESASRISGRGVGLDVVHDALRQVRGAISVYSIRGKGTFFEIQLPLTLSITKCLIVLINNEQYAFPLVNIEYIEKVSTRNIRELEGRQYIISKGKRIGIIAAQQVLELKEPEQRQEEMAVIVLQSTTNCYAMIVDSFCSIHNLIIQPLNQGLGKLRSVSAAAIADDGTPIIILDIQDLIQTMDHFISGDRLHKIDPDGKTIESHLVKRILVVDDSATVREVERKMLEGRGYKVDLAEDGLEAWHMVRKISYDLIVTDVDMPHMDGIELLVQVKESTEFLNIPVIIVSYKDRDVDRNRGLNAGADYYLTKGSFDNQTLLEAVEDLIGRADEYL